MRAIGRRVAPLWLALLAFLGWARQETVSAGRPLRSRYERAFHATELASDLERRLTALARRLRWQRTLQHTPRALLVCAAAAAAVALIARLFSLPGLAYLAFPLALLVGGVTVYVVARRQVGPFEVARRTDASLGLGERLATALELAETGRDGPFVRRQLQDALATIDSVNAGRAFPLFAEGTNSRRQALRSGGWGAGALLAALLLVLWPAAAGILPGQDRELLALADPNRREDQAIPRFQPDLDAEATEGIRALNQQPNELGEAPGLVGAPQSQPEQAGQQGQASSSPNDARREAAEQQNPNAAQREQALQELGNALRQSQTGRQAGDALRNGDTERASQQLSQLAEQARNLSPGERQSLSQAFQQAAQQIGDKDRALADAARRAGESLSEFRNREAQQAIRDAAAQVQQSGQQAQAQRDLEARQQQMQNGQQPQLPSLGKQSQGQAGRQDANQQGRPGASQAPGRPDGGQTGSGAELSQLEAELRGSGLQSGNGGAGEGGGTGAGAERQGAPSRLNLQSQTMTVEAEVRDGPSNFRPPNPNAPPAMPPPPLVTSPGAPASANPVGAALDTNTVPLDLADPVRSYFTPGQVKP